MQRLVDFELDSNFYEPEIRDNFYISGIMKRAWAAQLEVLREFDRICSAYGLRWFADWGTLLGAVRHKGFIPWDDDVDVCMLRADHDVFMSVVKDELVENYGIINSFQKESILRSSIPRLINNEYIDFDESHLKRFHGFPYSCGIDIFPLDYIPEDDDEWQLQKKLVRLVGMAWMQWNEMKKEEKIVRLNDIEELSGVTLGLDENTESKLLVLMDALMRCGADGNSSRIIEVAEVSFGTNNKPLDDSWYSDVVYLPFEGIEIPAPVEYKEVLRCLYGNNYMKPIQNAAGHDYPFFKRQKAALYEKTKPEGDYKKRELYVAELYGVGELEVCEYKRIDRKENEDIYLYFCQSEMQRIAIPHAVFK